MLTKKIAALASARGIKNAYELSQQSGIPMSTCYDLYTSPHAPSAKTLLRLGKFFQCSLDDLVEDD